LKVVQREKLVKTIKNMQFNIIGTNSFENSQVTTGGISTKEVDNNTLMSKINKNLYFAGEILDIDGDCGGYNLQWAWSSGYLAGISASKK
jgi:predicted flavoprotein YhiN